MFCSEVSPPTSGFWTRGTSKISRFGVINGVFDGGFCVGYVQNRYTANKYLTCVHAVTCCRK
jgi:hypothetical protein